MSEESKSPEEQKIEEIVKRACSELAEYADTVRIFVTYPTEDNCWAAFSEGRGNFYAQWGQVRDWMERREEESRVDTRREEE